MNSSLNLCKRYLSIATLIILFLNPETLAQDVSIHKIRNLFNDAVKDDNSRKIFYKYMADIQSKQPVVIAYKASAKALEAKDAWNPINKLSYLKEASQLFENAISQEPKNIELRFLRFSVQYYTPRWLGMSDELNEDKNVIITYINDYKKLNIDEGVLSWIQTFMIESGYCTKNEINTIKAAKTN